MPNFDNKIGSKYKIMTPQLMTSFHKLERLIVQKFLYSNFFVRL